MNICTYVNVCKMWKTPEKCGKLCGKVTKNVEMWKTAPKMWIKCG